MLQFIRSKNMQLDRALIDLHLSLKAIPSECEFSVLAFTTAVEMGIDISSPNPVAIHVAIMLVDCPQDLNVFMLRLQDAKKGTS